MSSTQEMRDAWGPHCNNPPKRYTTIPFGNHGARITVDHRTVAAFLALAAIMGRFGYIIRREVTGAFNCRIITGGSLWSLHAYGIAVDVNWDKNPYGPNLVTDMPPAMITAIEALRTRNGKQIFRWGGRYSGSKDAMHFEIICTPADLATGVVGLAPPNPFPLQRGESSFAVLLLEISLVHGGYREVLVDGAYGKRTADVVHKVQRDLGLPVDNKVTEEDFRTITNWARRTYDPATGIKTISDRGPRVRQLRRDLNKAGQDVPLNGSNLYDAKVQAAMVNIQRFFDAPVKTGNATADDREFVAELAA